MSQQEFRPRSFQILPPVVKNILIISGILFLAQVILEYKMNFRLENYLGLHYYSADYFKPYQFITYIFMHGNFMHIFFNMFAVWTFGSVLENVWGSKRFLIFYLITGMGAALTQYVVYYFEITPLMNSISEVHNGMTIGSFETFVNSIQFRGSLSYETSSAFNSFADKYNSLLPADPSGALLLAHNYLDQFKADYLNANVIVGASGSLFGLLLAFGMMFPNTYLNIYFFIPIKAKYFVILYGIIEIYSAISNNPQDNVAHFAHLGGMLFGFIMIMLWKKDRTHFY
ncbi:MAG: rhomboid family intramembrane serine protease [Bacteroidota bacterium]|nr:rhomboid family intramembrane serine protease [Bacteroidota bacterium]